MKSGSSTWGHVTTTRVAVTLTYHVSAQVNAEDGHSPQGQWNVRNNKYQEGGDFRNVTGEGVSDGFLQVIKDQTP